MGNSITKPIAVQVEEANWAKDHCLLYDMSIRKDQLGLLKNFGHRLQTRYIMKKMYSIKYQHWYITDGKWHFEFGNDGSVDNYSIRVHCNNMGGEVFIDENFDLTPEVFERMKKLCGATNYSLALRNCEHVARYIQCGRWLSMQMLGSSKLNRAFFKYMGNHTKSLNVLPIELKVETPNSVVVYPDMPFQDIKFKRALDSMTEADNEAYNVLVLGPTGSGKSTLINNLVNETVCQTGATADSVTCQVKFYQCRAKQFNAKQRKRVEKNMNIIDTIGFCDSRMSSKDVLQVVKSSVKVNVAYLDKVIIVCSGRIERQHQEAIKQFLEWLEYQKNRHNFVFIYNKAESQSDAERKENLAFMCDKLGADSSIGIYYAHTREVCKLNIAIGFPPGAAYAEVEQDHNRLLEAVLDVHLDKRLKVDDSTCNIL